jgi:hypothetical protein
MAGVGCDIFGMRDLRANESRTLGVLGIAGVALLLVVAAVVPSHFVTKLVFISFGIYSMGTMAWWGLRAARIYIDGDDLLVARGKADPLRLPIRGVTSARCGASVMKLRVLTLKHESGETFSTLVREHDITWIMAQMPDRAITIYWREMVTEGRTHF